MKQLIPVCILIAVILFSASASQISAASCKVTCKYGSCEITDCEYNALCKCNWLGNPICKCNVKGTIQEIGDVADDILHPD